MNRKPSILMFIHNFRPGPTGGAELQAEHLSRNLVKIGYPVQVLTRKPSPDVLDNEDAGGVQIHRVSFELPYFILQNGTESFRYLGKHRKEFDVIHCHMAYGNAIVGVIAAQAFRKKCIIKVACGGNGWSDFSVLSTFDGYEYGMDVLRQADAFIAISHDIEKELASRGISPDRIVYIPNGVDTETNRYPGDKSYLPPIRFVQIGRMHPQKGLDVTLKAVRLLKDRGLGNLFSVHFYGHIYPEHNFRKMAVDLGVGDLVKFIPFTSDILSIYREAQAFLLPSRGEGLSNSLLEAMSFELPAIATRVSGNVDVIEDKVNGILINPDSPQELADSMQSLVQSPELCAQLGKSARERVLSHFSLDYVARQYGALYERLCGLGQEAA